MPDYSKGKIYKLVSNYTDDIYIGSTCNTLSRRKSGHLKDYKRYLSGKYNYISSFKLFEKGNVDVVLIEECSVHNKDELHRRERYFIENYNCVNKCIPGRTKKEYYDDNKDKFKEYYEVNKDNVKQQKKQYYEVNKDNVKQQSRQHYENNKDKVKQQTKQYYENNKDKVKQQTKQYYENNNDKVKQQMKKRYEINKDKVKQQKKQYYEDNKDKMKQYYIDNKDKRNQQARQRYQKKKLEKLNSSLGNEI
jgi:hypothetical protein